MSCYAPGWVKGDTTRFERVRLASGDNEEIISPESKPANESDVPRIHRVDAMDEGLRL